MRAALLLIALAIAAYFPALYGGAIWDDTEFIFANPLMQDSLQKIWFTTASNDYWPLSYTWLWVLHRTFGEAVLAYHLANVGLHAINAILIHRILCKLGCNNRLLPAVVFAVHPVNVEAVAWMFQAKTLLASAFALGASLAFLRWEEGSRRDLGIAVGAFLCAMLSKTSAVMFPAVFLLLSAFLHGRPTRRAWIGSLPMAAIAVIFGAIAIWFHRLHYQLEVARDDSLLERALAAGWALWFYLYKALLPIELSFVYPRWQIETLSPLHWLPLLAAIAAAVFLALRLRPARYALGFFALNLVPVLGFVDIPFMQFSLVADHWQYPAIAGPLSLLALVRAPKKWLVPATAAISAVLLALTLQRAALFTDEISVYRDAADRAPDNFMVHLNLGKALAAQQRIDDAIVEFETAVRLAPSSTDALSNLASALAEQGKPDRAADLLKRVLELEPDHPEANYNYGNLLLAIGRFEQAASHFDRVLAAQPDHLQAHTNLGAALANLGRFDDAIAHLSKAIALAPNRAELKVSLARVQIAAGRREDASRTLEAALPDASPELAAQIREAITALAP